MLRNTFIHLEGIGERTEERLWRAGIRTWHDYLAACEEGSKGRGVRRGAREGVIASIEHFEREEWGFFEECLPSRHKWRALGDLQDRALYLDIETTGLGHHADITVIGTFDGRETKAFVKGQNLEDALDEIARHPVLVTFNGATFDMPMIRSRFPDTPGNHIHIDLRYPLKNLGYAGGLKHIESRLGIGRSDATSGLDGWDAVRLWRSYERGSREALELLLEYNREDVQHLQPLANIVFQALSRDLFVGQSGNSE